MSAPTRPGPVELPLGYTLRRPERADAQAVTDLQIATDIVEMGVPDSSIEDVLSDWSMPRFDLAKDAWVVQAPDRSIRGYGWVWDRIPHADFQGDVHVHPDHAGKGIEDVILRLLEERVEEHRGAAPAGTPLEVGFFAKAGSDYAGILDRRGYRRTRTFWRMIIDLKAGYPAPFAPEGIEIRVYRPGLDDRVLHSVVEESFSAHFRFAPEPHEEWIQRRTDHSEFDPTLWLIAWDGDEAAGGILAYRFVDLGWIRELGVRERWRGRGIGKALLLAAFRAFDQREQYRVGLGVDAANATGATRLYEDVGMHVESRHDLFQLVVVPPINRSGSRPSSRSTSSGTTC